MGDGLEPDSGYFKNEVSRCGPARDHVSIAGSENGRNI
jgi:hypothetical protein